MNTREISTPSDAVTFSPAWRGRPSWQAVRAKLSALVVRCVDRYAAATAYEELSQLSDTELARRGLSRDILARDL